MQVYDSADKATSTLVTKEQGAQFQVAQTAEFFEILSSTLYSNPMAAFIQEVICNAWDSHIDAGITDTPLNITLGDGFLTVQDFGSGIPHDKMVEIYCVYGKSTKKQDSAQTGGFGLGCKSPFAYTDNFQVTSCNSGVKKVYVLKKSDPNHDGLPSCVPILHMPCTYTGVTVSIPVKNEDLYKVRQYITQTCHLGSINALLDGEPLGVIDLGRKVGSYQFSVNNLGSGIHVRYGSVIYPVRNHEAYSVEFEDITRFLNDTCQSNLVIQAAPDSLAITPSREALSMQTITQESLFTLFDTFIRDVPEQMYKEVMDAVITLEKNNLPKMAATGVASLIREFATPDYTYNWLRDYHKVSTIEFENYQVIKHTILSRLQYTHFAVGKPFYYQVMNQRMDILCQMVPKKDLHKHLKVLKLRQQYRLCTPRLGKVMSQYHRKGIQAYLANPTLQKKPLCIVANTFGGNDKAPPYTPINIATSFSDSALDTLLKVRTIVLTQTRANTWNQLQRRTGYCAGMLQLTLPDRKEETIEKAAALFKKAGYTVLCVRAPKREYSPKARTNSDRPVRSEGGFPVLHNKQVMSISNMLMPMSGKSADKFYLDAPAYRTNPAPKYIDQKKVKAYFRMSTSYNKESECRTGYMRQGVVLNLCAHLFGSEVAIVQTTTQQAKFSHLPDLNEYFVQWVNSKLEAKKASPIMVQAATEYVESSAGYNIRQSRVLELIRKFPKVLTGLYLTPAIDLSPLETLEKDVWVVLFSDAARYSEQGMPKLAAQVKSILLPKREMETYDILRKVFNQDVYNVHYSFRRLLPYLESGTLPEPHKTEIRIINLLIKQVKANAKD